jgi:ATP-binding cassette, subfamily F, member 3
MSILTAHNLGVSFGAFDLFRGVTCSIANDSKIGLVGPNGVGKTSLLLILAGLSPPTTGTVHTARGRRIGYLRQEAVEAFANRSHTVFEEMRSVFSDIEAQAAQLEQMEAQMSAGNFSDELLTAYGDLQHAFEAAGGYDYELRIQHTLSGLGLHEQHWGLPLQHLSGGQKTRALLARLLLEKPDLLMLDEPSNHLDLESIEWLERTLREWEGAVLVVSHDRFFLDNTVNTIWEMTPSGIQAYSGGYSAYLHQRQERWEYLQRVFREEKTRLQNEIDFVHRNWVRASTHARALGLLRRLSRDIALVENFGILALRSGKQWSEWGLSVERPLEVIEAVRKINAIELPAERPPAMRPRLGYNRTSGNIVLRAQNLRVGYPGNQLFKVSELHLGRGECVALLGPNGSGKTTFLKLLLGEIAPLGGQIQLGASLKIGYFAQAHDQLNDENSVLEELTTHVPMQPEQTRKHLAQYLFRGEDVFKPVSVLSGGERARLALAILGLSGANFLLLDEPNNHIDIPAREALQEVLESFEGTILLVSHDRYLIDRLATQIWELRDGRLEVFEGSYREFAIRRAAGRASLAARKPEQAARQMARTPKPLIHGSDRESRRKQRAINELEERIQQQETIVKRLTRDLQKAGKAGAYDRTYQLGQQLAEAQNSLEDMLAEWESVSVSV